MQIERSYSDVGGVVRIGPPSGRLGLIGGSISFEEERPGTQPVLVTDTALLPDTSTALINRYSSHHTARLNALWGLRNLRFVRVSGFDALEGTQDLRTGIQLAMLVGKGARFLGGKERDMFGSTDIYYGMATPISFSAISLAGTGRRDDEGKWDGILAHGRAAVYLKPFNRQTWISDLTFSGGWKQRVPFQLTFADRDGGLRGFRTANVGGSRRLVARVEDRYLIGRYKQLASIAVAGFGEAGKIWAGDSPFGVNTPVYISTGFSILAASPPQSRRTIRADFAFPVKGRKEALRGNSDDCRRLHEELPGRAARHQQQPRAVSARVGVQLAVALELSGSLPGMNSQRPEHRRGSRSASPGTMFVGCANRRAMAFRPAVAIIMSRARTAGLTRAPEFNAIKAAQCSARCSRQNIRVRSRPRELPGPSRPVLPRSRLESKY